MTVSKRAAALAVAALLAAGCDDALSLGQKDERPAFRTAPIARTDIVRTVEATGTVTPRNSSEGIPVGAQVNGKLIKLFVDYNSHVTNGQVVALIDPLSYEATYRSCLGQLHGNEATVKQRRAALVLADKTLARKRNLFEKQMCSEADLDTAVEARDIAAALLESALASVEQAKANADKARTDLAYCRIVSPVNGVVIDRKVEEGETVVSSMNAVPVLTIAEDLATIWIEATVPEADIGNVKVGQAVTFTADAYRRKFRGKVKQIRKAATTTNNVVTFPVIIEAENPDEMLFPGMTATLSIETARVADVPAVAAAAFRFRPKAEDVAKLGDLPRGRKLWLEKDDGTLEYAMVTEGVSNDSFTEIVLDGRDALVGRKAVIGYQMSAAAAQASGQTNPFMPKPPQRMGTKGTAPEPKK